MQKNLILILARGLADELASAMFVVDHEGTLMYYNEGAEDLLGKPFGEIGEAPMEEWASTFPATEFQGGAVAVEDLPLMIALRRRQPAHRSLRVQAADGEVRDIAVTAFPLFARKEELVGAVAIFWEHMADADVGD